MNPLNNKEIRDYIGGLSELQKSLILKNRDIVLSADSKVSESIKWAASPFLIRKIFADIG